MSKPHRLSPRSTRGAYSKLKSLIPAFVKSATERKLMQKPKLL